MPDDVGGRPFPDGWEPDDDRGGADEDFAPVVFDEDFVKAALIREPSAVERLLAAAQARAEAEASRAAAAARDDGPDPYAATCSPTTRTAPTAATAALCAPTGAPPAGTARWPGCSPC
ncbi:hypothetical protein GCM10010232_11600 [Streptomyces amakusaensis]